MPSIQSLERAFGILEELAEHPGKVLPLGELARAVGLKDATCAHLVNTMVGLGYVEKQGQRGGYTLGARTYALGRNELYRRDLVARAEPFLVEAARELGETVTLSTLRGSERMLLCEVSGGKAVQANGQAERVAGDIYNAASTWLLLAQLPPEALARFYARHGRPWLESPASPLDDEALGRRLADLRRDKFCLIRDTASEICRLACPIIEGCRVTAAVGCYLPAYRCPPERVAPLRAALERAAVGISAAAAEKKSIQIKKKEQS